MTLTDGRVIVEVNFVIVCACFCARAPQILILNNPYDAFRAVLSPFYCVTCPSCPFSLQRSHPSIVLNSSLSHLPCFCFVLLKQMLSY